MARRLGIYTLGHYLSLPNALSKKIWNPLLKNYETWEMSYLDTLKAQDKANLEETLEGMFLTHQQILKGFFPLAERVECLERIEAEFSKNFNNLAAILSMEIQKPTALAQLECERSLDTINSERGTLGAKLNRLEGVTRNLSNVVENISAARGRSQDTDFASETAKLTRSQILQQAGTAMVAQANQLPQGVLSLLGR